MVLLKTKDNIEKDELKLFKDIIRMSEEELLNQIKLGSFIDLEEKNER